MIIAGLGDVHGKWREAMALVETACAQAGIQASELAFILQVGDAEALRDEADAGQVIGPAKYRKLGDFPEVISGDIVVPAPLYFIAGNHEPYAALDADGGLVEGAGMWGPGVTYLGRSGVVEIAGLRVGFLSGIFGEHAYRLSEADSLKRRLGRQAAHYTAQELDKLRVALNAGVDILVTHDWPTDVAEAGHFGPPGDVRIRKLIEGYKPILSLHGHMHTPASAVIGDTQVECLAIVGFHGDPMAAVGIWSLGREERTAEKLSCPR